MSLPPPSSSSSSSSISFSPAPSPSPPSSNSLSSAAIAGIVVASVVGLAALVAICVCLCREKKRPQSPRFDTPRRERPFVPAPRTDFYENQRSNWQPSVPPQNRPVVRNRPSSLTSHPQNPPQPSLPLKPQISPPLSLPLQTPISPPNSVLSASVGSSKQSEQPLFISPSPVSSLGSSTTIFTYEELVVATDSFSDANLLGQGGFGYVHKGILPSGKQVAVKQLKVGSGQGEREFQAEVEIISRVHHRHLVSLVGFCIHGGRRLLVYEYVPNNTLQFHLHGKGRPVMEWPIRMRIALGSAKGLAYLHEDCHPRIIHRDIKAANILLDYKFEAKVADFGLAKSTSDGSTHVSTRIMGTLGYLAPEYAASGKLTDKSDVFSFGVMLLELITGRRPISSAGTSTNNTLVDWARPLLTRALENGQCEALVDPRLDGNYNPDEMTRLIACAAASVRHSAQRRPRVSQIVRVLEGDISLDDLNNGLLPGQSSVYGSDTDYDRGKHSEDMKKFRKLALGSEDYASSEYSYPTSTYGLNVSVSSSEGYTTGEVELPGKSKQDSRGFSGSS